MWNEPNPDPGGESSSRTPSELSDLKEENEQQKLLIAQLKGMLRKEQSTVTQEKLEEYVNTFNKVKAKMSRNKREGASGAVEGMIKTEKICLLKQQLEENKAKLAERGKSQKDIEEMVSQLKAQFNDSQQLIQSSSLSYSLPDPKNLEYTKDTNREELYNILLMKEKRIMELLNKNQKHEATILDLQENLKEKDSVIDARTKAITLMTDSLSKRSKTSLDALDETKEQMRKMQEHFVTLESDMKARQMALLNDLKMKNLLISELNEKIQKLEIGENSDEIIRDLQFKNDLMKKEIEKNRELEKKLNEALNEIESLKNGDEVNKLKKQLEESNKNMIKIKAQSKSKIKELNKKVEGFKKASDVNVLVIQLQDENTKLSERIAELEEEKGNLQLKMVESTDSTKDINEFETKITLYKTEIEEKDKIISLLEADILSLKVEISTLNEKLSSVPHLENNQVTSEMKNIQIEEDLEKLYLENENLKKQLDKAKEDNEALQEKINELVKEKQELTTKLENYIQENMELIDKLEKLSAEKVSSAESIEIVEGLTQQEKLELAAYQKHINEEQKIPEEVELTESVMQLSEDSAELLNKIEMFNTERKEVMEKMEALREENNTLSLKISEIENSREVLADTYEQLQSEKEELQKEYDALIKSVGNSKDSELEKNLQEKITQLETKLHTNAEEITNYQNIIEENKSELITSSNLINELQNKLRERDEEIKEFNVLINDLNNIVSSLQKENEKLGKFETLETQVEELRTALDKQMEQAQDYAEEAASNNEIIDELKGKLDEMQLKITETERECEIKNMEFEHLKREILAKEDLIRSLQSEINEKDEKIKLIGTEMKEKYLSLQKQLDGNNGSLEKQIEELTNKNKEQLERMKKIAATLKKKTQAYNELEEKYSNEREKWETEFNKKESDQLNLLTQVKELKEEINMKTVKLEEAETRIRELTIAEQELQNTVTDLRRKQEKITEVNLKQELSTSLHEEFEQDLTNRESVNEEKIRELELIVETNEADLNHYKFRLQNLEQELSKIMEERDVLQSKLSELQESLHQESERVNEKIMQEETLEQKLEEMAANDELLEQKLMELTDENRDLTGKVKEQDDLINKLKIKVKKTHEKITQLKAVQQTVEELEITNAELKRQLGHLEANQKHMIEENEELQRRNQRDYEKIEADYQGQLEELLRTKNELSINCEKLQEEVRNLKEKEEESSLELKEYKAKVLELDGNETKLQKLGEELHSITVRYESALNEIENVKLKIEELNKELLMQTARDAVNNVLVEAKDRVFQLTTKETQTEYFNEEKIPIEEKLDQVPKIVWPQVENEATLDLQPSVDLESQIVSAPDITDSRTLQKLEFEPVVPSLGEQNHPVLEELSKPKQAYLTFQPGVEAVGENDDGWGWGPEEAKLEEEHQSQSESAYLKVQLAQATEKIQVLQMERENLLEDIKQLQVKSGKLVKKCKELKAQNDKLSKKSDGGDFFDLNNAIEEELKLQIAQLEKKIKEVTTELEKEKSEKCNILKRVEVLTTANERLVENKQIQDSEIFRWKRKYEELEEKMQQSEWNTDGFNERTKLVLQVQDQSENVAELEKTIKELTLDNEELQMLLNEQRELRIQAEKSKGDPTLSNVEEKIKYMEHELTVRNNEMRALFDEKNKIIDELQDQLEQKRHAEGKCVFEIEQFSNRLKELESMNHQLENIKIELNQEVENLKYELEEKDKIIENLKVNIGKNVKNEELINNLQLKISSLENNLAEKDAIILQKQESEINYELLIKDVETKENSLKELRTAYEEQIKTTEMLTEQNHHLNSQIEEMRAKVATFENKIEETKKLEDELKEIKEWHEVELAKLNVSLEEKRKEFDLAQIQTSEEWQRKLAGIEAECAKKFEEDKERELKQIEEHYKSELVKLNADLQEKQKELELLQVRMEDELQKRVVELEEKWAAQVDERGNTVAESWKYHLAMVEEEFVNIRKELKNEIQELEAKCNILVNENNELRKNVDTEIKNEVDRVSTLQQSINELSRKLNEQEEANSVLKQNLAPLEQEVASLKLIAQATQQQFEEKREVVEEIVKILELNSPWPIGCEKNDVLNEFQRQLNAINEKQDEINKLTNQIQELNSSNQIVAEKEAEIALLKEKLEQFEDKYGNQEKLVQELQLQVQEIDHKEQEIIKLQGIIDNYKIQLEQVQQQAEESQHKDQEIIKLQGIIDNYKIQLEQVQQDLDSVRNENSLLSQTLDDYKSRLESYQQAYTNLEQSYNDKLQETITLNEALHQAENLKVDNNKEVERLQNEIEQLKNDFNVEISGLKQELDGKVNEVENVKSYYEQNVGMLQGEVNDLKSNLQCKDQEVLNLNTTLQIREQELNDLNISLQSKEQEFNNMYSSRVAELETYVENLLLAKDNDLKSQQEAVMNNLQNLNEKLESETSLKNQFEAKCSELELKVAELNALIEEENKQLTEMRKIIEEQVGKIEKLKSELYEKSKDYDSLVAEISIAKKTEGAQAVTQMVPVEDDLTEPVSRAELDLALYMLHQRDVRCEELTVELTQLLEERDTLQLKLSNALREKEEIRSKLTGSESEIQEPQIQQAQGSSSTIETAIDPLNITSSIQDLATKLSELRKVNYKRDKTFVDEREQRRLQQISIMQQHISEASKLPPEAAAKLVDATYTLSRDVQSPSKVLLNWLWGRSTPKQNDT